MKSFPRQYAMFASLGYKLQRSFLSEVLPIFQNLNHKSQSFAARFTKSSSKKIYILEVFIAIGRLLLLLLLLIHTFSVLSLQLKKLRRYNKSAIDLSNANPACGHKEVRRSTAHIMVTTRYSDEQGSKSRQKVMRLYKQCHRPISKRFIKPPYSISRANSIDSECCHLPTTSVLSNKPLDVDKL